MPAFRLPDDGNCPVFKIPPLQCYSVHDLRPVELGRGNMIRIGFRDRRKDPMECRFLGLEMHPFHDGIVKGLKLEIDEDAVTAVPLEDIDTITKLAPG